MAYRLAENLAVNVKRELQARGWTQTYLAELCGWAPPRITDILRGDLDYRLATVEKLATAFGVPPASLVLPPTEVFSEKISE